MIMNSTFGEIERYTYRYAYKVWNCVLFSWRDAISDWPTNSDINARYYVCQSMIHSQLFAKGSVGGGGAVFFLGIV